MHELFLLPFIAIEIPFEMVAGFLIVVQLVLHVRGLRCPQGFAASDGQLDLVRL